MNKDLNYYLSLKYPYMIVEDDDGSFFIEYPDLPGCMTCGDTVEEAIEMLKDAKIAWMTTALEIGKEIPEPKGVNDYSGQFKLRLPKTLHKNLAETAKEENISMNQFCVYLLAKEYEKEITTHK